MTRQDGEKRSTTQLDDRPMHWWLLRSAASFVALCLATATVLWLRGLSGVPVYYFYSQDAPLLIASATMLLLLSMHAKRLSGGMVCLTAVQASILITVAAVFAYAGSSIFLLRYPMSRDEILAQFAADSFGRGQLGWPIPPGLHDVALALMPVWSDSWIASGYWVSPYLPVNSSFRALAALLGDAWLTGPLLLAVGTVAMWRCARRLWPTSAEPATVVLLLALTSSQLLINAMSAYAMTAHFALNALWLLCFLRGGRTGHSLALVIGLLATGLHQLHFHLMFISGFVIWLWLVKQRRTAVCYVIASLCYIAFWQLVYGEYLLGLAFGEGTPKPIDPSTAVAPILAHLARLRDLEPFSSLARFAAWQNILLLPLAALGASEMRKHINGMPPITIAFALSCAVALATMPYQGFGYGYRYLHGTMPCFLLLAAGGWTKLGHMRQRSMPSSLILAASTFALLVTLPFTLWQSHALLAPYAASFKAARSAPADVVLVDARGGGFLQDIIRIDRRIERPLLLDLAYVSPATLVNICRSRRVMLFDGSQAKALGVMGSGEGDQPRYRALAAARRRTLADLRCETPVPLPRSGSRIMQAG